MRRPNQTPSKSKDTGNKPVHTIRHRNIKASIWRNETAKGVMYDVKVIRSYKDNDQWNDSYSFGYDDLLIVAKLVSDAHTFITSQRAKDQAAAPRGDARRREQLAS